MTHHKLTERLLRRDATVQAWVQACQDAAKPHLASEGYSQDDCQLGVVLLGREWIVSWLEPDDRSGLELPEHHCRFQGSAPDLHQAFGALLDELLDRKLELHGGNDV